VVEKSMKKRSLEKRKPRKSEMRQQSAWSRNQKVEEAGAFVPAPPPSAADPSPPATPVAPRADERRSPLCGSSDFIIAAVAGSGCPGHNRIGRARRRVGEVRWVVFERRGESSVGVGVEVKCGARNSRLGGGVGCLSI
jgi:hypothetical protein